LIVVDSSVLIDFFYDAKGQHIDRFLFLMGREQLLLGDLVLCEVLRGARSEDEAIRIREKLLAFATVEMVGEITALRAAINYRVLRKGGVTMASTVDLLIGTFCILNRHRLLHNDSDFKPMVEHLGLMEA
jgi:predicted nucleic acid-binding protein